MAVTFSSIVDGLKPVHTTQPPLFEFLQGVNGQRLYSDGTLYYTWGQNAWDVLAVINPAGMAVIVEKLGTREFTQLTSQDGERVEGLDPVTYRSCIGPVEFTFNGQVPMPSPLMVILDTLKNTSFRA